MRRRSEGSGSAPSASTTGRPATAARADLLLQALDPVLRHAGLIVVQPLLILVVLLLELVPEDLEHRDPLVVARGADVAVGLRPRVDADAVGEAAGAVEAVREQRAGDVSAPDGLDDGRCGGGLGLLELANLAVPVRGDAPPLGAAADLLVEGGPLTDVGAVLLGLVHHVLPDAPVALVVGHRLSHRRRLGRLELCAAAAHVVRPGEGGDEGRAVATQAGEVGVDAREPLGLGHPKKRRLPVLLLLVQHIAPRHVAVSESLHCQG